MDKETDFFYIMLFYRLCPGLSTATKMTKYQISLLTAKITTDQFAKEQSYQMGSPRSLVENCGEPKRLRRLRKIAQTIAKQENI